MQKRWRFIIPSMVFGCAFAVAVYAQSTTSQPPSTAGDKIMLTGCVERADQLNGLGVISQSADVDSLSFALIHAERGTVASQPSAVGTSGSTTDVMKGNTYRLDAAVPTLNPHVGHQVEITGVLFAAPSTPGADPTSLAGAPRVKVDEIRMVSETCPR